MSLIFDVGATFAVLVLAHLAVLILFERGTSYHISDPVHHLNDDERMRLLATALATPTQSIRSLRVLPEGLGYTKTRLQPFAVRRARCITHQISVRFTGRAIIAVNYS